jgi:hypothetical protein
VSKGIIMQADSVNATLAGRKTQTRRVVKPQPPEDATEVFLWFAPDLPEHAKAGEGLYYEDSHGLHYAAKPRYAVGEVVYVKHRWYQRPDNEMVWDEFTGISRWPDGDYIPYDNILDEDGKIAYAGWEKKSPLFMPEWAARLHIRITDVVCHRLQAITEGDIWAEGIEDSRPFWQQLKADMGYELLVKRFSERWDAINATRGYPWESNPWVFAYTYEVTP